MVELDRLVGPETNEPDRAVRAAIPSRPVILVRNPDITPGLAELEPRRPQVQISAALRPGSIFEPRHQRYLMGSTEPVVGCR